MTAEARTEAVKLFTRVGDWWLRNAAAKHGVPVMEAIPEFDTPPPVALPAAQSPSTGSPVAPTAAAKLPGWAKAAAIGVGSLVAAGSGAGLLSFFRPTANTTVIEQPNDGSLTGYLQDRLDNVPPGAK